METNCGNTSKNVRQGDTISPKLFIAALLEGVFRKLNWDLKGITINGEKLNIDNNTYLAKNKKK